MTLDPTITALVAGVGLIAGGLAGMKSVALKFVGPAMLVVTAILLYNGPSWAQPKEASVKLVLTTLLVLTYLALSFVIDRIVMRKQRRRNKTDEEDFSY